MNKDVLKGKWRMARGDARQWWGKLTHNRRVRIAGVVDKFAGLLQQEYGYGRRYAEKGICLCRKRLHAIR